MARAGRPRRDDGGLHGGRGRLPALVARLIAEGLDPATPAAMMENVSLRGRAPPCRADRTAAAISSPPTPPAGPCLLLYGRALAELEEHAP